MTQATNGTDKGGRDLEVITTHVNADYDALASMLAAAKLYPEALLILPGAQERNLRNFFVESTCYLYNFVRSAVPLSGCRPDPGGHPQKTASAPWAPGRGPR